MNLSQRVDLLYTVVFVWYNVIFFVYLFVLLRAGEQGHEDFKDQPTQANAKHEFNKEGKLCP